MYICNYPLVNIFNRPPFHCRQLEGDSQHIGEDNNLETNLKDNSR